MKKIENFQKKYTKICQNQLRYQIMENIHMIMMMIQFLILKNLKKIFKKNKNFQINNN